MKKTNCLIVINGILIFTLLFAGCGGKSALKEKVDCKAKYIEATAKYEKEKYSDAKEILHDILYQCTGSKETVKIMYYLGMSYYHLKKYNQAEYQFRDIVRDFNADPLAETSQFMVGKSLWFQSRTPDRDQTETKDALVEFKNFLSDYPKSVYADSAADYVRKCRDKLANKEYLNGRLYVRMQEYSAAVIYFEDLLENYADTKWIFAAKHLMAFSYYKQNKKDKAKEICDELLAFKDIPDDVKEKTLKLIKKIEK